MPTRKKTSALSKPVPVPKSEWEAAIARSDLTLSQRGFLTSLVDGNCDYKTGKGVRLGPKLQTEKHIPYQTAYRYIRWARDNGWLAPADDGETYILTLSNMRDQSSEPLKYERSSLNNESESISGERKPLISERKSLNSGTSNEKNYGTTSRSSKSSSSSLPSSADAPSVGSSVGWGKSDRVLAAELCSWLDGMKWSQREGYQTGDDTQMAVRNILSKYHAAGKTESDYRAAVNDSWGSAPRGSDRMRMFWESLWQHAWGLQDYNNSQEVS